MEAFAFVAPSCLTIFFHDPELATWMKLEPNLDLEHSGYGPFYHGSNTILHLIITHWLHICVCPSACNLFLEIGTCKYVLVRTCSYKTKTCFWKLEHANIYWKWQNSKWPANNMIWHEVSKLWVEVWWVRVLFGLTWLIHLINMLCLYSIHRICLNYLTNHHLKLKRW